MNLIMNLYHIMIVLQKFLILVLKLQRKLKLVRFLKVGLEKSMILKMNEWKTLN